MTFELPCCPCLVEFIILDLMTSKGVLENNQVWINKYEQKKIVKTSTYETQAATKPAAKLLQKCAGKSSTMKRAALREWEGTKVVELERHTPLKPNVPINVSFAWSYVANCPVVTANPRMINGVNLTHNIYIHEGCEIDRCVRCALSSPSIPSGHTFVARHSIQPCGLSQLSTFVARPSSLTHRETHCDSCVAGAVAGVRLPAFSPTSYRLDTPIITFNVI